MTGMAPTRAGVRYDSVAFVLPIYFGLTLLMTFPLVLNWRSALPDGGSDLWLNYWNFWWWKQSLLEWRSPFWSSILFHPFGVDLRCHTHSAFNQILAMPVNLAAGEAAAYNFSVFFQLTLAAFATWLLVRHVTGNAGAAFFAGLIFAFLPYTMDQSLEHLNLVSAGFLPLVLFFLLRWRRSWRIRDALGFGACFGLNALCSWHLGILASLVVAPGIILSGWKVRRSGGNTVRAYVRGVLAAGAIGALLMLPFVPLDGFTETNECVKWRTVRGIDPTFLLTPSHANPVAGPIVSERYARLPYVWVGFVCYLGFVPLGLAAAAVLANFRRVRGWLALFAAALVLAVGSPLIWDGVVRESVVLPFELVRELPVVKHLRVANRFMTLAGLALAVLAGYGAVAVRKALPPGWRRCALPVAAVVLLTEYSWLPYPIRTVEHSPLLQEVAARPGAVLDVPFFRRPHNVRNQVAQTVHGRPITAGYVSIPHSTLRRLYRAEPALAALADNTLPADVRMNVPRLRELGFATLVIHKRSKESWRDEALKRTPPDDVLALRRINSLSEGVPDRIIAGIRGQLDAALGGAALEDDRLAIYFLDE